MPRKRPQQTELDEEWLRRRAVIAVAGEIAHNAGTWLLTSQQVGAQIGRSQDVVDNLRNATEPIPSGPPMRGWIKDGKAYKLPADKLAEWLNSLEEVA